MLYPREVTGFQTSEVSRYSMCRTANLKERQGKRQGQRPEEEKGMPPGIVWRRGERDRLRHCMLRRGFKGHVGL